MNKSSAIALVVIGVLAVFFLGSSTGGGRSLISGKLSLPNFGLGKTEIPSLNNAFTITSAWGVFQDYLKAAQKHDLATLKKLSYQLSETCTNPEKRDECNALMDNVYEIAHTYTLKDFTNVAADDKQIIMSTDFMDTGEGADNKTKIVLFFVKDEKDGPKVLSIKYCYGNESPSNICVNTDPASRDSDKDGYWDDIEAFFHK